MIFSNSISFPKMFSRANGNTLLDTNYESINNSIGLILQTAKNELLGSQFGSNTPYFVFENLTEEFRQFIIDAVVEAIAKHESRVVVTENDIEVEFFPNEKRAHLTIHYTLRNTNFRNDFEYDISGGNQ